jgi:ubiquinone/menaquinone biosynthesis C-methylase UbiE
VGGTGQLERAEDRTRELRRRFHPEDDFGGFTELDGAIRFYARVRELLAPDGVALDVGCGRGTQAEDPVRVRRELRILRGHCARVIGIDVDPVAAENEFIDEFRPIPADLSWPMEDASVDLALADFVVEHVADPDAFFAEAARVIKPGGYMCMRTINVHSYLGIASRAVPSRLHAATLKRAHPARQSQDVFPTVYRCNTRKRLAAAFDAHGFDAAVYTSEDEPAYLTINPLAYRLGLAHRRFAPRGMLIGLVGWGRRRA